jgi:hypothetical protein
VSLTFVDDTCKRCLKDKHDVQLFSAGNNIHPCPVPSELLGLTPLEELLIAQLYQSCTVTKRKVVSADTPVTLFLCHRDWMILRSVSLVLYRKSR